MSDQPPRDHNLELQVPGIQEALSNLSAIASSAGLHVLEITLVPNQRPDNLTPTRVRFGPSSDQPTTLAATRPSEPQAPGQSTVPIPYRRELLPAWQTDSRISARPKRASTSITDDEKVDASLQGGKRKRLSDPAGGLPGGHSGAFWGTVLQERSDDMRQSLPSQHRPMAPPLVGPSSIHEQSPALYGTEPTERTPIGGAAEQRAEGQVHRTATLPSLRLRSPRSQLRRPTLPSLQEASINVPGRAFRERYASELNRPRHGPTDRRFLRSASQILGRFSPFGSSARSASTAQAAPLPPNVAALQQVDPSVFPPLHEAVPQQAPEIHGRAGTDDTFHSQVLTAMRAPGDPPGLFPAHYGTNVTPQSGSRSASGSGVSNAHLATTTSPPVAGARARGHITTSGRGRRGRRGGSLVDREQFFECEHCRAKFKRKSDKNRHVRVVHEKSRPFICPVCKKSFGEKSNMLKHRASVHDDVRVFRCPYCDMSFSQRGLCDHHVKTVHDRKQAKYFCEHCGLPFSRKAQLNEHYEQLHPEHVSTYGPQHGIGASSSTPRIGAPGNAGPSVAAPYQRAMVGNITHGTLTQGQGTVFTMHRTPLQGQEAVFTTPGTLPQGQGAVFTTPETPPQGQGAVLATLPSSSEVVTTSQPPHSYPVPQPGASRAYERTGEEGNK